MKKTTIVFILFALIIMVSTISLTTSGTTSPATPELPNIDEYVTELPTSNIGPGTPAIVFPGDTFTVVFKQEYAPSQLSMGYIFTVKVENDRITTYNYTVTINKIDDTHYNITIPTDATGGLYDLVLYGSNKYVIPRSVWIITSIGDILNIVHVSDLHFGTGYPDETIGRYKRFSGMMLAQLLSPDLVIDTGDEADTQATTQYREARAYRYAFLYSLPVLLNPGNHDYPNENFIKYYGTGTWYRLIGNKILIIALNTREFGTPDWSQLKWTQTLLDKYKNIPIKIIQFHHPVFYWQGELHLYYNSTIFYQDPHKVSNSPVSYYWGGNLTALRYFLKLCEDYNVSIVFAGHIHRDQFVKYVSTRTNTTTYFITTTTLAHGTGTYNGLNYIRINLENFSLEFPYKSPWFAGFENISRNRVYNSLPNTRPDLVSP
ncbi:MAG: metallophosphoesterase, partial [Thermoprotei archaeon]